MNVAAVADIVIAVRNVTLSFDKGQTRTDVLRGIDLSIKRGESVAVLGPSGSGKSSLMAVMSGLERASSGEVRVAGIDLADLDELERKPDLVLVGLGANDALRGLAPAETRRNLDAILAELKTRGIPVLLTGMMAPRSLGDAYVRSFDSIYPDLAKKYGTDLDPFFMDGIITNPHLLLADGLHPNPEGIKRMADRVAPMAQGRLKKI